MRAQVLTAFNQDYVYHSDLPTTSAVREDDIVIRVTAASYCHTDAVYAAGAMAPATLPRIGCHEFAGEVHAHGSAVPVELKEKLPIGSKIGVPVRERARSVKTARVNRTDIAFSARPPEGSASLWTVAFRNTPPSIQCKWKLYLLP